MEQQMRKQRVLAVDDDPMIRSIVQAMLEAEGFQVVSVDDGARAIEVLDAEPRPLDIALVVLDVIMPGMNGLDVLTRMKLHAHTRSLPVLMLTGESKGDDILSGYSVGADYYIPKPFTRQQLMYGVRMVLGEKS